MLVHFEHLHQSLGRALTSRSVLRPSVLPEVDDEAIPRQFLLELIIPSHSMLVHFERIVHLERLRWLLEAAMFHFEEVVHLEHLHRFFRRPLTSRSV